MKAQIFCYLFLLTFLTASGQIRRFQELKEQLRNHPQRDTFRASRLNDILLQPALTASERDSLANELLLLSRQFNYKEGEAHALMAQIGTKDRAQAIDLIKQALAVAERSGNKSLVSEVSSSLGYTLGGTGQTELALHYLLRGVALAQAANDKKQLATAQIRLSGFYSIISTDIVKALDWGLKALHTAEEINDTTVLAGVWFQMTNVYGALGDTTSTLAYYQKALEADKKTGDIYDQAVLLNNKGELYRLSGKYKEALKDYEEALKMTDNPYIIELVEGNEADVYDRMGDYSTAKKYSFSALRRNRQSKMLELRSWCIVFWETSACIQKGRTALCIMVTSAMMQRLK